VATDNLQSANKAKDPLVAVLEELEGPPVDYDRSKNPIMLHLTNRLVDLQRELSTSG